MMFLRLLVGVAFVVNIALAGAVVAHELSKSGLTIVHPWVRATAKAAVSAAGYVKIINRGAVVERLLGATIEGAAGGELHETTIDADGVARMRMRADGMAILPGETLELKPLAGHIMFLGLTAPLERDRVVKGTLVFEKAGSIAVEFFVERAGASEPLH